VERLCIVVNRTENHTADLHGWHRDNTIGPTPPHNPETRDWVEFFRAHRLQFQLDLAARNGYSGELQDLGRRRAGDLRPGRLLWRSRDRHRDDPLVRWFRRLTR